MKALVLATLLLSSTSAFAATNTVKCNVPVTLVGHEKEACILSGFKNEVTYIRCDEGFLSFDEKDTCSEVELDGKMPESGIVIIRTK